MDPLAIHKKFVLVLSFWEVQDSDKVVVAVQREQMCTSITTLMLWTLLFHGVPENSTISCVAQPSPSFRVRLAHRQ